MGCDPEQDLDQVGLGHIRHQPFEHDVGQVPLDRQLEDVGDRGNVEHVAHPLHRIRDVSGPPCREPVADFLDLFRDILIERFVRGGDWRDDAAVGRQPFEHDLIEVRGGDLLPRPRLWWRRTTGRSRSR
jgi:hypothetical protein